MSATAETPTLDLRAFTLAEQTGDRAGLVMATAEAERHSRRYAESRRRENEENEERRRRMNDEAIARKVDALKRGELGVEEKPEPRREMPYDLYERKQAYLAAARMQMGSASSYHYGSPSQMGFASASAPYRMPPPFETELLG